MRALEALGIHTEQGAATAKGTDGEKEIFSKHEGQSVRLAAASEDATVA